MRNEPTSDIQELLQELEALHIREAEVVARLRESLAVHENNTANPGTERQPSRPSFLDARGQQIVVGDAVEFFATTTVSGGQGIVTGYTKGADPFLRIRRNTNARFAVNREVRRKPKNVVKLAA